MSATTSQPAIGLFQLSASEMAQQIAAGSLTSVELVEAHLRRIAHVNPQLNAVAVPLFEQAHQEAAAADARQHSGQPLGPLHGVPISVKECFHVAGTAATEGIGRFSAETMTDDGPLVKRLRQAGAIVLAKTNVPQLMLMHETDNPLFGRTNNPWDVDRVPGGSSGGEAALIAAGGSPLGLANDIGGSIRYPAHCCGICGIKPTTHRFTNAGVRDNLRGMEAIRPQPGPLARHVDDLYLALKVLVHVDEYEIDSQMAPVPFGDPAEIDVAKLRIGFWTDDGQFPASPALRRAVHEATDALRQLGAQVEEYRPPEMQEALRLYFGLMSADGGADAARLLGPSQRDWRVKRLIASASCPRWFRWLLQQGALLVGQQRTAQLLSLIGRQSVDGYWQMSRARADFAERFFSAWSAARWDVLLCPPHALPALRHGDSAHLALAGSYGYWANVLGVPAGVVPITRVLAHEQAERPESRDVVMQTARQVDAGSFGLPVGVQVVSRPWREDQVLAVMSALEKHFRATNDFPLTPIAAH
jgi:fatty acid amide hydrolase